LNSYIKAGTQKSKVGVKKKLRDAHEDSYKSQTRPHARQNTAFMNLSVNAEYNNPLNNPEKLSFVATGSKFSNKDL
jgi:hypothetical protein